MTALEGDGNVAEGPQVFAVKHRGPDGTGTGVSVVVASSQSRARSYVADHLRAKPEGYRQFCSPQTLEVEPYDDFAPNAPVTSTEAGVVLELSFPDADAPHISQVVFLRDAPQVAERLERASETANQGRGVSCVRSLVFYLRRGDLSSARACASNEGDKIRSYPEVVDILKEIGFWMELRRRWS